MNTLKVKFTNIELDTKGNLREIEIILNINIEELKEDDVGINDHKNDERHDNNSDIDDDKQIEETEMRLSKDAVNTNDRNLVSGKNEFDESNILGDSVCDILRMTKRL